MRYHGAEDGFQITPRQACHRPRGVEREWIMDAKKVAVRNVMCFIHEREGGSKWMEGRMKNMAAMMDNKQSDFFFLYILFPYTVMTNVWVKIYKLDGGCISLSWSRNYLFFVLVVQHTASISLCLSLSLSFCLYLPMSLSVVLSLSVPLYHFYTL